ncbi:MAG: PepSY domain-containing protein [Chloroflexota bacterium]
MFQVSRWTSGFGGGVGWLVRIAVMLALVFAGLGSSPLRAETIKPSNVPVVGCEGSSIAQAEDDEGDDGEADGEEADADEDGPFIEGSIKAPRGMKENDKRLAALAKISKEEAREAAFRVIADPDQRRVRNVSVEAEHGFVVYAVKTRRIGRGADPFLEVKVDAGTGQVLLIECDPEDD